MNFGMDFFISTNVFGRDYVESALDSVYTSIMLSSNA